MALHSASTCSVTWLHTTHITLNIAVNHLIYADDLVCIAPDKTQLQALIDIVNAWSCKFRIEPNLETKLSSTVNSINTLV